MLLLKVKKGALGMLRLMFSRYWHICNGIFRIDLSTVPFWIDHQHGWFAIR
jgi:hypothetical protein